MGTMTRPDPFPEVLETVAREARALEAPGAKLVRALAAQIADARDLPMLQLAAALIASEVERRGRLRP